MAVRLARTRHQPAGVPACRSTSLPEYQPAGATAHPSASVFPLPWL